MGRGSGGGSNRAGRPATPFTGVAAGSVGVARNTQEAFRGMNAFTELPGEDRVDARGRRDASATYLRALAQVNDLSRQIEERGAGLDGAAERRATAGLRQNRGQINQRELVPARAYLQGHLRRSLAAISQQLAGGVTADERRVLRAQRQRINRVLAAMEAKN